MNLNKAVKGYLIRSYEGDKFGNLRIITLFNIMQDIADFHAEELGLGLDFCRSKGLAWVGANYHVKITRLPRIHDRIIVHSWPAAEKKLGAVREFFITDKDGNELIRASSLWILINFEKKRPVSLKDNLPEYQIIPERVIDTEFEKIDTTAIFDKGTSFKIRFDDIDINNHVNNAVYPLWACESVGDEFRSSHMPKEIEISFKKEALAGESIFSAFSIDNLTSVHTIYAESDKRELARLRIIWQRSLS